MSHICRATPDPPPPVTRGLSVAQTEGGEVQERVFRPPPPPPRGAAFFPPNRARRPISTAGPHTLICKSPPWSALFALVRHPQRAPRDAEPRGKACPCHAHAGRNTQLFVLGRAWAPNPTRRGPTHFVSHAPIPVPPPPPPLSSSSSAWSSARALLLANGIRAAAAPRRGPPDQGPPVGEGPMSQPLRPKRSLKPIVFV